MRDLIRHLLRALRSGLRSRRELVLENLALRQQLAVLRRGVRQPRLRNSDRRFWIGLSRWWGSWRELLALVKPDTFVKWHRRGCRAYWGRKCGPGPGRPRIDHDLRDLIRRMAAANPLWGAPKIHGELLMLGIEVSEATVSRNLTRKKVRGSSQSWKTFLDNHVRDLVALDSFSVPTASLRALCVFLVLSHDRRQILHLRTRGAVP